MNGRHCYRMSSQAKNNGVFSFFEGLDESSRTLMVIIPHEDDEINLSCQEAGDSCYLCVYYQW